MQRVLLLLASLGLLAGCIDATGLGDPYKRPGTFAMDATNEDNLRAMLANPNDFQEGRGVIGSSGYDSAAAVGRLRSDTVKELPDSALVKIGGSAGSGGQGGGAGAGAAGGGGASQ